MAKILGISGSPRKSSTEYALNKALEEADRLPGIDTEMWSVRGKEIKFCTHCDYCVKNKDMCFINDDVNDLIDKMLKADGFIIASPVYDMNISAQLAACFNRTRPLFIVKPGVFANKVGGAISLGGTRHGGQETTIQSIIEFYLMNGILVTGGVGGCYSGGTVWTRDNEKEGVKNDLTGLNTVRGLGRAVAEASIITTEGKKNFGLLKKQNKIPEFTFVQDHELFE